MPTQLQKILTYSMNYLMRYPTSTGLFLRKLRSKFPESSEEDIAVVVERVTLQRLLDDAAYGRAVAATLVRRKSVSFLVIKLKLQAKLLPKQLIEAILSDLREETDEYSLCLQAAQKKLRMLSHKLPEEVMQRLHIFLLRKGFNIGVVMKVIAEMKTSQH